MTSDMKAPDLTGIERLVALLGCALTEICMMCLQEKLKPFLVAAGLAAILAALAEACLLASRH